VIDVVFRWENFIKSKSFLRFVGLGCTHTGCDDVSVDADEGVAR
jgi:hypothetical protein